MEEDEDDEGRAATGRVFGMRIVNLDYYMAAPLVDMDDCYSHFLGRSVMEVPVVRMYGSTLAGQKTCLHLHKAFPYFYVPYETDLPQDVDGALAYIRRLALALERAMKMASVVGSKRQHIHSCSLVRARKFYGYHPAEDTFVKITLYYPQEVNQMCGLLLGGGILDRKFQPYESHVPYLLQIKIDYNLSGMGLIELSSLRFRLPIPDVRVDRTFVLKKHSGSSSVTKAEASLPNETEKNEYWLSSNVSSQHTWSDASQGKTLPSRCSTCELEADAKVEAILNRASVSYTPLARTERGRMMVQSLVPMWEGRKQDTAADKPRLKRPRKLFAASPMDTLQKEILEPVCQEKDAEKKNVDVQSSQGSDLPVGLIECSQPANLHDTNDDKYPEAEVFVEGDDKQSEEHANRSQLDNSWKVADEETLELLKWMMASQRDISEDDQTAAAESEKDLCRLFEGDGVEAALQKSISTFETLSQQECQEILECCEAEGPKIPQLDGTWDEEKEKQVERTTKEQKSSKRNTRSQSPWAALPVTVTSSPTSSGAASQETGTQEYCLASPQKLTGESKLSLGDKSSPSASIRDLMRIKRGMTKARSETDVSSISKVRKSLSLRKSASSTAYGPLPFSEPQGNIKETDERASSGNVMRDASEKVDASCEASEVIANIKASEQLEDGGKLLTRPASPKYDEMHVLHETPDSYKVWDARKVSKDFSQLTGPSAARVPTPASQTGFRDPASCGAAQQVTLMSIEVLAETRGSLRPDPRYDAICCIAIVVQEDTTLWRESVVLIHDKADERFLGLQSVKALTFTTEGSLLHFFIQLVRDYDPDILMGWDIQRLSIGFIAERCANLGISLLASISRTPSAGGAHSLGNAFSFQRSESEKDSGENAEPNRGIAAAVPEVSETIIEDEWGRTHGSGIYVGGRSVLNLWRIMRGELKLGNYSIECVAETVLKRKVPRISWSDLTDWFRSGAGRKRYKSLEYFADRALMNVQIIDQLDLVNRTAELARVFGIDFYSVFSRGSQYRVESMMLRLAHSQNFLAISPSKEQVAAQPAMECLPLVMEPESRLYKSPVVVLDFQSLYPSMIIAYNLCFSTCLGKCISLNPKVLGVTSLWLQPEVLKKLMNQLTVTPNNVMFVPPEVAPGVLPRLLQEILSTRIMIKNEMKKLLPSQRVLHRVLNARQFALKLIANVTYGYTAAGFSGRMPCAEIADSIVQLGRHTLEQAIEMVNNNPAWGGRVVYGDTDSMFVLLDGRTREEAFRIGQEIASAVTAANPDPVTLKLEKVYHPCVLLTKKRYVGYSYESPAQVTPTFDAKGIETVRRDSCGAVAKTMEKSLRILFETYNLTKVQQYLHRQWQKIYTGRVSLQDFIFSKEVRLGTYSTRASVLPPAAIVASKAMAADPRAEPCYGERIQYVVVHGKPGSRLADLVIDPYLLLDENKGYRLHDTYYINKQIIPALQRVLGLVGVDLTIWLNEMPRVYLLPASKRPRQSHDEATELCRGRIDHYYVSQHCAVCGEIMTGRSQTTCQECSLNQRLLLLVLGGRVNRLEREYRHLHEICDHCGGGDNCISLNCLVFLERAKVKQELENSWALCHW